MASCTSFRVPSALGILRSCCRLNVNSLEDHVESFEHSGGRLIDEVLGDAQSPHLIFLHGWGASRDSLRGIGVLFQPTHRVHLIDLPGFGDAPAPPPDWDTIKYTDLVQNYILEHVSGPVVLIGHSFGGRIAVRLASRRLPQIRGLVLMAVPGLPTATPLGVRIRRLGIRWLRRALVAARPLTGPGAIEWHTRRYGSKDYLAAGPLRPILVRTVNEDLTESARSIECPALLIWGTDDRETPPSLASRYQQLLNGRATLSLLPHKDHHLYTGTGAHLCAFEIRSWLPAHVHV
jgi:pimeloyl-ACP methyl ester carboxylesterase